MNIWYLFSNVLYYLLYYLFGYRKKVVLKNLRKAFPEKDEAWIQDTAKKFYRHLSDYFVESLKIEAFSRDELKRRCVFKNLEVIDKATAEGRDVIAYLGHYANWEWVTSLPLWIDMNCLTVYRPLSNPYFNRYFLNVRQRFGVTTIPMKSSAREIIRYSKEKRRSISGFISDQNPGYFEIRNWVKFLNHDTAVFEGGEKIAKKIDAAVVYFKMRKVARGYYETEIIPMFDHASATANLQITKKYFELLEDTIIEQPELWLWSHKRWKHKKPKGVISSELRA